MGVRGEEPQRLYLIVSTEGGEVLHELTDTGCRVFETTAEVRLDSSESGPSDCG